MMNWEVCGRKWFGPNIWHYLSICFELQRKTTKSSVRIVSEMGSPPHVSEIFPTWPNLWLCFLLRWWIELYKLSYLWYSLLGFLFTIIMGLTVSILTGSLETCHLDEDLMSPPVRRWLESLPSNIKQFLRLSEEVTNYVSPFPVSWLF